MKKLWLILLSLGLVMAFSVSAPAADVKFSGEYYAAGLYLNHVDLKEDGPGPFTRSTAFFYQRLRLGTDFIVSPCLRLVTRMDIMERVWEPDDTALNPSINSDARNLDFDIAYVDYTAGNIGNFRVGYQLDYGWGTIWGNRTTGPTAGQIQYRLQKDWFTLFAGYAKEDENDYSAQYSATTVPPFANANDRDFDSYRVGPIFNWKGNNFSGETGILFIYNSDRRGEGTVVPYHEDFFGFQPYFKAKIGPVSMQGEINYATGEYDFDGGDDTDIDSFTAFLDADAKFGPVSIGGSFAFVQGDDDATDNEVHNRLSGGRDWDPCLIMFNNTTTNTWVGQFGSWVPAGVQGADMRGPVGEMRNAWFGQLRAGVTPIDKLTFNASVSYAAAHEDPENAFGDEYDSDYGWELDVTGTYKITNNLSYMLGGAYFWTGDYFEAGTETNDLEDNYMIINKLTLNF